MNLTRKQLEYLALAAQGFGRLDIAKLYTVSPSTVDHHFKEIRRRLEAHTTAQAVVLAITNELLVLHHTGYVEVANSVELHSQTA